MRSTGIHADRCPSIFSLPILQRIPENGNQAQHLPHSFPCVNSSCLPLLYFCLLPVSRFCPGLFLPVRQSQSSLFLYILFLSYFRFNFPVSFFPPALLLSSCSCSVSFWSLFLFFSSGLFVSILCQALICQAIKKPPPEKPKEAHIVSYFF